MSFLAKLNINDEEFNVLECSFDILQKTDHSNRPSGIPIIGTVDVLIETSNKTNFYAWSFAPNELKDGEIVFFKRDLMASYKTIVFKKAYCVEYFEVFNNNDQNPMKIKLTLACNSLDINGVDYVNPWGLS